MTGEEIEQRVRDDLAEYLEEQGHPIPEGRVWHYKITTRSEWTGDCDTCAFEYTVTAVIVYFDCGAVTMEGFNMADFLTWVYAKG